MRHAAAAIESDTDKGSGESEGPSHVPTANSKNSTKVVGPDSEAEFPSDNEKNADRSEAESITEASGDENLPADAAAIRKALGEEVCSYSCRCKEVLMVV